MQRMPRKRTPTENWVYINLVNHDPRPKATHKALLHALISFRNNDTGVCSPSIDGLAERAGMSRRSVLNILPELREWDFVDYVGKPNVRTRYEIYPTPCRFGISAGFAPEPYKREEDFSKWSDRTIKEAQRADEYIPSDDDYGSFGPLDHDKWNKMLYKMHRDSIDRIAKRTTGVGLNSIIDGESHSIDPIIIPF